MRGEPPSRDGWLGITRLGPANAIQGWAGQVSAIAGGRVRLYVSTTATRFGVEACRIGWYGGRGGRGARLIRRSATLAGRRHSSRPTWPAYASSQAACSPMPLSSTAAEDALAMVPSARRLATRATAALAALALLAGCSHDAKPPAAASPSSTGVTTTTAGPAPPAVFPLTGLPVGDGAAAARPALSIKVENTPPARPQAGLDAADVVTEELVEGGITRFFVTFQSHGSPTVGPVRSARTVDAALLRQLGGGLFAYSGAAAGEIAPVKANSTAALLPPDQAPDAYRRVASRPAPHNLYTSTDRLYQAANRLGARRAPPPKLFRFAGHPPAGGRTVRAVAARFSPTADYVASWRWDPRAGLWDRYQGGRRATVASGAGVTATNVVVLRVKVGTIPGLVDSLGNPDPNVIVVGKGACWVLRDGRAYTGTWQRPAMGQVMRLVGAGGQTIVLHPGRTWIELEPAGYAPRLG